MISWTPLVITFSFLLINCSNSFFSVETIVSGIFSPTFFATKREFNLLEFPWKYEPKLLLLSRRFAINSSVVLTSCLTIWERTLFLMLGFFIAFISQKDKKLMPPLRYQNVTLSSNSIVLPFTSIVTFNSLLDIWIFSLLIR